MYQVQFFDFNYNKWRVWGDKDKIHENLKSAKDSYLEWMLTWYRCKDYGNVRIVRINPYEDRYIVSEVIEYREKNYDENDD